LFVKSFNISHSFVSLRVPTVLLIISSNILQHTFVSTGKKSYLKYANFASAIKEHVAYDECVFDCNNITVMFVSDIKSWWELIFLMYAFHLWLKIII